MPTTPRRPRTTDAPARTSPPAEPPVRRTDDRPLTTDDTPPPRPNNVRITYRGPIDPKDRTRTVIVPLENPRRDETFPIDHPVETTQETANRLADMAGHTFHIEPARPEGDMTHVRQ